MLNVRRCTGMRTSKYLLAICSLAATLLLLGCERQSTRTRATKATCVSNLRAVDEAEQVWAFEKHKTTNDTPNWSDIAPYVSSNMVGTNVLPRSCPSGGTYTLARDGEAPSCSIVEHQTMFLAHRRPPVVP